MKLIRRKSLFLWYTFTFNVVITHEIITFQDICMDKIPKDFTSIKDTYYAALIPFYGNMAIIYELEDNMCLFQNSNSTATFDQYLLNT